MASSPNCVRLKSPVSLRRKRLIVSQGAGRGQAVGMGFVGFERGSLIEDTSRATRSFDEDISLSYWC
jgi:hypothetical protein